MARPTQGDAARLAAAPRRSLGTPVYAQYPRDRTEQCPHRDRAPGFHPSSHDDGLWNRATVMPVPERHGVPSPAPGQRPTSRRASARASEFLTYHVVDRLRASVEITPSPPG